MDQWYQRFGEAQNMVLDLQLLENCHKAMEGASVVYNLAADMGGMGFIENNKALCMLQCAHQHAHLCMAAREVGAKRYYYASSACVYNADKQRDPNVTALKEEDAYPGMPEDGYGWEKLFSEHMCRHFREDFKLETRLRAVSTMSMAPLAPGTAGVKKPRPPFAAR